MNWIIVHSAPTERPLSVRSICSAGVSRLSPTPVITGALLIQRGRCPKSPRRLAQQTQEEISALSQCQAMKDPLWELVSSANV